MRERATIYVRVEGRKWRLHDHEGKSQGVFGNLDAALTAARYIARDHMPSCVKAQDANGAWMVFESFEGPETAEDQAVSTLNGRRRRKWFV
ncbi:MAG: hypothetical protein WD206_05085 [Actinomycetota bacterium]